jgi:hypothetical protein
MQALWEALHGGKVSLEAMSLLSTNGSHVMELC